jgi:hypothetical protein
MQPVKSHHYTELSLDLAFIVAHKVLSNTKASTRCQCFFCRLPPRQRLASGRLGGVDWLTLCNPLSSVKEKPPRVFHEGLARVSLLNEPLSPRSGMAEQLHEIRSVQYLPIEKSVEFIDVSPEEDLAVPGRHLSRLWMRFQEGH